MIEMTLPDMTCGGCARGVTAAIKAVDPTAEIVIDVPTRIVQVTTKADNKTVRHAVTEAGFTPA